MNASPPTPGTQVKQWLAVYTKPRWEKKIDSVLIRKGITSWCPVQKSERQWSDRKKIIEEPLFRSYVFVHVDPSERIKVLSTEGVLNFVYYLGKPAIIRDEEIDLIRKYLGEKTAALTVISEEGFKEDMRVMVNHGVFMDNEGTVVRGGKKKVYVRLESLGQVMIVEFPAEYISPVL
jgi:transcription antitermination factor NusG